MSGWEKALKMPGMLRILRKSERTWTVIVLGVVGWHQAAVVELSVEVCCVWCVRNKSQGCVGGAGLPRNRLSVGTSSVLITYPSWRIIVHKALRPCYFLSTSASIA